MRLRRCEIWRRPYSLAAALRRSRLKRSKSFFSYGTARLLIDQHIARRSSSMPSGPSEGVESASGLTEFRVGQGACDRTSTTSQTSRTVAAANADSVVGLLRQGVPLNQGAAAVGHSECDRTPRPPIAGESGLEASVGEEEAAQAAAVPGGTNCVVLWSSRPCLP